MANYYSVEEMFNAGTSNMTTLINNSSNYDDSYYTLKAPDFINYDYLHISGNSWIGFDDSDMSTNYLSVNSRDTRMYYLLTEEGTVRSIKFFKLRWSGFSIYSDTSNIYKQTYDVVLWENGSISVKMVTIPTEYNNGNYLLCLNGMNHYYSVSMDNPHVSFEIQKDGSFEISNEIISFYRSYCLVKYNDNYYTDYDPVEEIEAPYLLGNTISSDIFLEYGYNPLSLYVFKDFDNYQVVIWEANEAFSPTAFTIFGYPPAQEIYYNHIDIASNGGISKIELSNCNNVLFQISFDNGQSWKYYNEGKWNNATSNEEGMTSQTVMSLVSDDWSEFSQSTNCIFKTVLFDDTSSIGNIYIKYNS